MPRPLALPLTETKSLGRVWPFMSDLHNLGKTLVGGSQLTSA